MSDPAVQQVHAIEEAYPEQTDHIEEEEDEGDPPDPPPLSAFEQGLYDLVYSAVANALADHGLVAVEDPDPEAED